MTDTISFIKSTHQKLINRSLALNCDETDKWARTLIVLYLSLIELCGCIITLLEHRGITGAPSILRTMLETYVEFENLSKSKSYGYLMEWQDVKNTLCLLKEAEKGANPFLAGFKEHPQSQQLISFYEQKLSELEKKGGSRQKIDERFKNVGMGNEYLSLYKMLCSETHSNLFSLTNRHIEMDESGCRLVIYRDDRSEYSIFLVDIASNILIKAATDLYELLSIDTPSEISDLQKQFKAWEDAYMTPLSKYNPDEFPFDL